MLLGKDLFYAAQYKTVSFKSDQFKSLGNHQYHILGQLTIRGVTRPAVFDTTLQPVPKTANLMNIASSSSVDLSDFGMKKASDGMAEKVNIQINGQWKIKP